jgi:6,7-dimethyl-8-ribityllumazine synthase
VPDGVVDLPTVERIIGHLTDDGPSQVDPVQVINSFDIPRYRYELDRKAFIPYDCVCALGSVMIAHLSCMFQHYGKAIRAGQRRAEGATVSRAVCRDRRNMARN